MKKPPASEAIEHALADHGVIPAAEDSSAEGKSGAGETGEPSKVAATDVASEDEAPQEETTSDAESVESTSETPRSSAEDGSSVGDSVQSLVDAALKRSLDKYGRQVEKVTTSPNPDDAYQKLLSDLAAKVASKPGKSLPTSLKDVDVKDPEAVQAFFDQRMESLVRQYIDPIAKKTELREIDMEFTKLQKDHPDYHNYGKAMSVLIGKFPNMPLEYAYRIASTETRKAEGRAEAYENMSKKKVANLEVSTARPKNVDAPVKVKNIREAVLRAVEESGSTFGE